jgi:transcriptional regulator with XRE-family HTH domain
MTGEYPKRLSKNLKRIRADTGLTQVAFARKLGISQASLNRLEQASQNVALKTIETICKRLKITPNELLLNKDD